MKIVTIVGARPQFVKAAAVSRAIARHNSEGASPLDEIHEIILHTGQHFDGNMSDIFFQEMEIPKPEIFLDINSVGHGAMTGRMLEKIEEVLIAERPDCVLVYGDTNSTLAGALAAKKLHIKLVHIEAGLRSFNMQMPEEINRIVTDRISDVLCCPTQTAVDNLIKEGFRPSGEASDVPGDPLVVNIGDVMLDAALYYSSFSASKSSIISELGLGNSDFALCTIHRAENTDDATRLADIFGALSEISSVMKIVLPLHPRTRKILQVNPTVNVNSLLLIDPVGYFDMLELLKHTSIVLTDSGGLQKEAYFFGKPCVTLRDETEWIELVQGKYNVLAGADRSRIVAAFNQMKCSRFNGDEDIYGRGDASLKVVDLLQKLNTTKAI